MKSKILAAILLAFLMLAAPVAAEPLAEITSPNSSEVVNGSVDIKGTASDTGSFGHYNLSVTNETDTFWLEEGNDTSVTDGVLTVWNTDDYAEGTYDINLFVYNTTNGTVNVTSVLDVEVDRPEPTDTTPPSIDTIDAPDYVANNTDYTVSFTYTEENVKNATVTVWNGAGTMNESFMVESNLTTDVPFTFGEAVDGTKYNVTVEMCDDAGNCTTSDSIDAIEVDNVLPQADISSPADGATVYGTIDIVGNATDDNTVDSYIIHVYENETDDEAYNLSGTGSVSDGDLATWDTTTVDEGDYDLQVEITDVAGNTNASSIVNVTVDYIVAWNDSDGDGVVDAGEDKFGSIADAVSGTAEGGTVTILPGDYKESVDVSKGLYIQSGSPVKIDCNGSYCFNVSATDGVTIYDIEMWNASSTGAVYGSTASNLTVEACDFHDNGAAVKVDAGADNVVKNCDVYDNTAGVNYGGTDTLDARYNWWGDPSGPSGEGQGTGDSITTNVTYIPWFGTEDQSVYFTNWMSSEVASGTSADIDHLTSTNATFGTDVFVNVTTAGADTEVVTGKYSGNPVAGYYFGYNITSIGKFVDVYTNDSSMSSMQVRLYYTEADMTGKDNSTFEMYYWNETASDWEVCSVTGEVASTANDGYLGYVFADITSTSDPSLSDLNGTVFSAGGEPFETNHSADPIVGGIVGTTNTMAVAAPYIVAAVMGVFAVGAAVVVRRR